MTKMTIAVICFAALVAAVVCDVKVIFPTYQTTKQLPKTRSAREANLEHEDYIPEQYQSQSNAPMYGEVRLTRSLDSPSAKRGGGSHTTSSGSRDSGPTHPGYNRRNTRSTDEEPLWLNKGDDVIRARSTGEHPTYIDDVRMDPNRRYARSFWDDIFKPRPWEPHFPRPRLPSPFDPTVPEPTRPIYVRNRRDFQYPKWNPHVPSGPWVKIPTKKRM